MMGTPSAAPGPSGVPANVDEAGLPVDCWERSGELEPRDALGKGRRVVVTEFDVEFVDYQFQLPTPRQPMFKSLPVTPNPVHVAVRLIGIGRRYSRLAEERQQALASDLYDAFLRDLRRRGLVLVSQDELHASPAYAELRKKPVVGSSPLMLLNTVGNDTGTVLHMRTVAAPGLCIVRGGPHAREEAASQILRETCADVALAVRLRVGTFQGQPALGRRSVIHLTTCEGSTTLRACHSLVSDLSVIDQARFRPVVGRIEPIEPQLFSSELTTMLPRFIALALVGSNPRCGRFGPRPRFGWGRFSP